MRSMKYHLKRVMSDVKLTFEECSTVLTQIEACMNSRPLVALPCDGEGIDVLTPGHFIIGAYNKWHKPSRNMQVNDIVVLQDANLVPTKWPLGRVVKTFHGEDHLVRVVDVKTQSGIYRRPVTKVALILSNETE